jgi:GNAT superfamily N-acetyltransferase
VPAALQGIPGVDHDPEDYPLRWVVKISTVVHVDDKADEGEEIDVGEAVVDIVPDAGLIDLLGTLAAVDQELADVAEMLIAKRPDLVDFGLGIGGDLMWVSSIEVAPEFRGHKLGHEILRAALRTIGRATTLVVLRAAPLPTNDGAKKSTRENDVAKASLAKCWKDSGFIPADGDYMVYDDDLDELVGSNRQYWTVPLAPSRS